MNIAVDLDTSLFTQMCRELARKCDVPPTEALREETGKILSKAIDNTDAADVSKIKAHSANAKFTKFNGKLYNLAHHYPNTLWRAIQAARLKDLAARLAARGLAKQSFYKIGEILGLAVEAPAYVKKAVASTGKQYNDEKGRTIREKGFVGYEFETSQPTVNAIGGERALQQAIDGRVLFFLKNIEKDVFKNLDTIAKKYPGVTVSG